jgi:hypothetical protein
MDRGRILSFLDLSARRGWVVSATPQPLYPGKDPVPIVQMLGGPQGWSGRVRKISPLPGFDPRTVQPVVSRISVSTRSISWSKGDQSSVLISPPSLTCNLGTSKFLRPQDIYRKLFTFYTLLEI